MKAFEFRVPMDDGEDLFISGVAEVAANAMRLGMSESAVVREIIAPGVNSYGTKHDLKLTEAQRIGHSVIEALLILLSNREELN